MAENYKVHVAQASEYAKLGGKFLDGGDRAQAREFYIKAARSYQQAVERCPNDRERQMFIREIDRHVGIISGLTQKKKQKVSIGGGVRRSGGGQQDDEDVQKEYVPLQRPKERFVDVAGLDYVKKQFLDALVNPDKKRVNFDYYGVKAPKGILLYGPPGCGKTYIVQAAAGEIGAAFFYIKLSDVISKWVGDTEKNLAQVFKTAEANTPSIIMLDEMDSVGRDRSMQSGAYKQFVTQILQLLDGAEKLKSGVYVVGATNLPWEMDPAIIRTGRLNKCILVPPPDLEARLKVFQIHCKGRHVADSVDFSKLARESHGFTASDIAAICNDAATALANETAETGALRPMAYEDIALAMKYDGELSEMKQRMRPSLSLISWLGKVKRSPKARDFPDLMRLVEDFNIGDAPDASDDEYKSNGKGDEPGYGVNDKPYDDTPTDADSEADV